MNPELPNLTDEEIEFIEGWAVSHPDIEDNEVGNGELF